MADSIKVFLEAVVSSVERRFSTAFEEASRILLLIFKIGMAIALWGRICYNMRRYAPFVLVRDAVRWSVQPRGANSFYRKF